MAELYQTCFTYMGKQKLHTLINVLGLAIGLSFTILIYLFVADELSFDRFHEKGIEFIGF